MHKNKKIIILVACVIGALLLGGTLYTVFKTAHLKKVSSLTDIEIIISEKTDTEQNNPHFGEHYLLQEIKVENSSGKDIILLCNTNEDTNAYVGLGYLDKIGSDSTAYDFYSVLYAGQQYTFENIYYFSTEAQKETILKELNRDYVFKLYLYDVNQTLSGSDKDVISVPSNDYVLKEVSKESINTSLSEKEKKVALSLKDDLTGDYDIIKYNEKLYSAYDESGRDFTNMWRVENNSALREATAVNYFTDGDDAFNIEQEIEVSAEPSLADVFILSKEALAGGNKLYCNTAHIGNLPGIEHSAVETILFCEAESDKEILKVNEAETTALLQKEMVQPAKTDPVKTRSIPQQSDLIYDVWIKFGDFSALYRYGSVFYSESKWFIHYEYSKIDDCLECSDSLSALLSKSI